jgi:hypothetical protein
MDNLNKGRKRKAERTLGGHVWVFMLSPHQGLTCLTCQQQFLLQSGEVDLIAERRSGLDKGQTLIRRIRTLRFFNINIEIL